MRVLIDVQSKSPYIQLQPDEIPGLINDLLIIINIDQQYLICSESELKMLEWLASSIEIDLNNPLKLKLNEDTLLMLQNIIRSCDTLSHTTDVATVGSVFRQILNEPTTE